MSFYKKKPIIIEAIKWVGSNLEEVDKFIGGDDRYYYERKCIVIFTPEGNIRASLGDWIIKGVSNEFYPCKPDIFEKTYEYVGE
jgi:hypothetical protein